MDQNPFVVVVDDSTLGEVLGLLNVRQQTISSKVVVARSGYSRLRADAVSIVHSWLRHFFRLHELSDCQISASISAFKGYNPTGILRYASIALCG
jgi:hypothetical protein